MSSDVFVVGKVPEMSAPGPDHVHRFPGPFVLPPKPSLLGGKARWKGVGQCGAPATTGRAIRRSDPQKTSNDFDGGAIKEIRPIVMWYPRPDRGKMRGSPGDFVYFFDGNSRHLLPDFH